MPLGRSFHAWWFAKISWSFEKNFLTSGVKGLTGAFPVMIAFGCSSASVTLDVDEQRRPAELEACVRVGTAVGGATQHHLVEVREARHVVRKERDLGDPSHVGTIGQC